MKNKIIKEKIGNKEVSCWKLEGKSLDDICTNNKHLLDPYRDDLRYNLAIKKKDTLYLYDSGELYLKGISWDELGGEYFNYLDWKSKR